MVATLKYNPGFLDDDALVRLFVVRQQELALLLEPFAESPAPANPHRLVLGLRGMGKTAIVRRVAAALRRDPELAARWHPVVFPEEGYLVGTAGELWLEALLHLDDPTGRDWRTIYEALRRERDDQRLHDAALAHLLDFSDEQGKRLVLVVENLQMLADEQIEENEGWVLRHTLLNEPRIFLLATATQPFADMEREKSPYHEIFEALELHPLSTEECDDLWQAANGQHLGSSRARAMEILTGGNPRLLMILAEFAQGLSFSHLMTELTALVDEHTDYFKGHIETFRGQERRVFAALAEHWEPVTASQVAEAARLNVNKTSAMLGRMVKKGRVRVVGKRGKAQLYQLSQRLYNLYYLMRCRGGPRDRVRAVVAFMVAFYEPPELTNQILRLAEECCGGQGQQRWGGCVLYEEIVRSLPTDARRLALEKTPPDFWKLDTAPRHLRQRPEDLLAAEPGPREALVTHDLDALRTATRVKPTEVRTWRNQALQLLSDDGDLAEAESAVRMALQLEPADAPGWRVLIALLGCQGTPEAAEAALSDGLKHCPEDSRLLSGQAWLAHKRGEDEVAIEQLERSIRSDPEHARAWGMLGRITGREGGDLERAEACLRTAVSLEPDLLPAWEDLHHLMHRAGRAEEVAVLAQEALDDKPDAYVPLCAKGVVLASIPMRHDEAERALRRASEIEPAEVTAWGHLGELLTEQGRFEEAVVMFRRTTELEPQQARGWTELGMTCLDLGRPAEAEAALERALAIEESRPFLWNNLGVTRLQQGNREAAAEAFERALELEPSLTLAWANLARLDAMNPSRRGEAIDAFERALDADPSFAPAWEGLSYLLFQEFDAEIALEMIHARLPEKAEPPVLNALAWSAYKARPSQFVLQTAVVWAREALAQRPDSNHFHHTLACLLGAVDEWELAWQHVEPVLRDAELTEQQLPDIIEFYLLAAASRQVEIALERLRASPTAPLLEPMEVALATLAGEQPLAPQEVQEMVTDILQTIEQRREELHRLHG